MTELLDHAPEGALLDPETYAWRGAASQTGLGAFLRANVAQGWWSTLAGQALVQNDAARADDGDVYLTEREWRASPEFREGLRFEPGLTRGRARFNATLNDELRVREDVIQRRDAGLGEMALGFGAAMIGGLPTPENFIPFTGAAWRAAQIARFGSIGGRTVAGAADAALGTAFVSPLVIASQQQFGDRVDFADALLDIAMGAALGSMIGAGSGVLARWQGRDATLFATQRAYAAAAQQLDEAAGAIAEGRPVRIDPAMQREIDALRGQVAELDAARQEALAAAEAARRAADAGGRLADIGPGIEVRVRAGADSDITFAVRYEVVEADTLITSHLDDFTINPAFDQTLQIRERDRDASIIATRQRASNLDAAQLLGSPLGSTGAPIVAADGTVESGNGRTLSLRMAYREGMPGAQAYRDTITRLGFDITGMRAPVVIRRRIEDFPDIETRRRAADDMNRDTVERKTASEEAAADARLLTPAVVAQLRPGALTSAGNAGFVRAFVAALPAPEQGNMTGEGNTVSADGLRRLERAMQAAAYADRSLVATLLEDPADEINRLGRVLKAAAPSVLAWRAAVAEGRIISQLDGTADLVAAAMLIADARRKGRPLVDLLNIPGDMFGDGPTATTRLWLSLMLDRRANGTAAIADPDKIAARVEAGRKLAQDSPQAPDMFGAPPPTIRSVLATLHMQDAIDLPFLPDAIRDFADPAPRSLAGPSAEAPPPPRASVESVAARSPTVRDQPLDPDALRFIDDVASGGGDRQAAFRFERLDDAIVQRIRADTGRDLTAFDHVLPANAVRHILNRHGVGGTDVRVRPITAEDIASVPALIRRATEIEPAAKADGLLFRVPMPDGVIAVIEQVGAGRRRLALKSMFFERGAGPGAPRSAPREPPPAVRPGREPGPGTDNLAPTDITRNAADPELDLIAAAVADLARAGALTEADAATLRAGNQAGDQAEAMAAGLEAAGACMIRTLL